MEATIGAQGGGRVRAATTAESVSCYCKADLRTVVGVTKFSGAKLCTQPEIIDKEPRYRNSPRERRRNHGPLLPGLPDDLAIICLTRVPRIEHQKLRLVCKNWNRLLSKNYFYSLREKQGMAEEWVYVIRRDREGKISWQAFDPIHQLWQPLPPIPVEYSEALGFGSAVLSGFYLYLFGGKGPVRGSMRHVIFYNARTNKWHRAQHMLRKRQFFGSCVIDNRLYVAGGECEGIHRALRSVEVYDPNHKKWNFVSEMTVGMVPFIGVVYEEKWFLKGLDSRRQVMNEVYMPTTNNWSMVNDGMVNGWHNPSVSINGKLYASDCSDGCKLRVYDGATDSWNKFMDSKQHLGSTPALEAAALVSLSGKLCIIRNNMSISLVDVCNPGQGVETNGAHAWETITGKGHLKNFVTNLWASIAGWTSPKSHIVHCQVLHA